MNQKITDGDVIHLCRGGQMCHPHLMLLKSNPSIELTGKWNGFKWTDFEPMEKQHENLNK